MSEILAPVPVIDPGQVAVRDRVGFLYQNREYRGRIRRKGSRYAYVVCDGQQEFRVPYARLCRISSPAAPAAAPAPANPWRLAFRVNDRVRFRSRGGPLEAVILRLNPKKALVLCDDGKEYRVPYEGLEAVDGEDRSREQQQIERERKLQEVAERARGLLDRHGLQDWGFRFDEGIRRAGSCRYRPPTISLAQGFALAADGPEIEETLLHEIAHALVGSQHHHDARWRAKALEIGCSGQRCHELRFTPPRYIVRCENRCWVATAERRIKNGVCRRCRGRLVYLTYSEERYQQEVAAVYDRKRS